MSISNGKLPAGLNVLLTVMLFCTVRVMLGGAFYPWGIDSMQLYGAADLVNRGDAHRLYDEAYFQELQKPLAATPTQGTGYPADDCSLHYFLYPPVVALVLSPWARLSYPVAQVVWFLIEGLGFAVFAAMVCRGMEFSRPWRMTVLLALSILMPLWMAFRVGQLTIVWLIALLGGLLLHQRERRLLAGLAFSLLAMKPPLALPLALWLVMRRDGRTLAGMLAGAAAQNLLVMACLGPGMPLYYLRELPNLMQDAKVADFPAAYEQSIAGTAKNVLRQTGFLAPQYLSMIMLVQVAVAIAAGLALYCVVLRNRRRRPRVHGGHPATGTIQYCAGCRVGDQMTVADRHCEYAAAVLFMALSAPHLLLYDAGILAVAMTYLWLTSSWRMGVALLLSMTTVAAIFYGFLAPASRRWWPSRFCFAWPADLTSRFRSASPGR